jgi:hypothetical protein
MFVLAKCFFGGLGYQGQKIIGGALRGSWADGVMGEIVAEDRQESVEKF